MRRQIAFTLRFDHNLYERMKAVSHQGGTSITAFVQEAVVLFMPFFIMLKTESSNGLFFILMPETMFTIR